MCLSLVIGDGLGCFFFGHTPGLIQLRFAICSWSCIP
jgi:hypothetical protein